MLFHRTKLRVLLYPPFLKDGYREFVALAEKYGLSKLLEQAINDCAAKIPSRDFPCIYGYSGINTQGVSYESLCRICWYVFSSMTFFTTTRT